MSGRKKFYLDNRNGKWMGVCAGISNMTGIDATIVRIAVVLLTVAGGFPWTVIAYVAAGFLAKRASNGLDGAGTRGPSRISTYDLRTSMSDIDRRLAEVDSYVAHSNTRLAREIDELR